MFSSVPIKRAFEKPVAQRSVRVDLSSGDPSYFQAFLPKKLSNASVKRQTEYLAGRYCLKEALNELGFEGDSEFLATDHGPEWPEGFVGSLTHSGGFVSAVVASRTDYQGIGIDSEWINPKTNWQKIEKRVFTPHERKWLSGRRESQKEQLFWLIFSAKESLFKCLYPLVKVFFGFQDAEMVSFQNQKFQFRLKKKLGLQWKKGALIEGGVLYEKKFVHTWVSV